MAQNQKAKTVKDAGGRTGLATNATRVTGTRRTRVIDRGGRKGLAKAPGKKAR